MIKNNFRILKKPHANLQTIAKAPVKFQKDWPKTVGGVEGTRYLLKIRNHAPRTTERRGTKIFPIWCNVKFVSVFTALNNTNQRPSGSINAHLTPGPGMYFKAFIHVYSPRAGADNPLGTNIDVNRKPLSLCPSAASFKTISLKYDFKHILNDFNTCI